MDISIETSMIKEIIELLSHKSLVFNNFGVSDIFNKYKIIKYENRMDILNKVKKEIPKTDIDKLNMLEYVALLME